MAEVNPEVQGLLSALGGEPPSPEMAGMFGGGGPPPLEFAPIPPPLPVTKPLNKNEARELAKDARSNTDPLAGMKRFGELAKLAGNGARVRVRKRLDSGHLMHIEDFGQRDVEHSGDLESFLNRYVKPKRGGGHYELSLVDPRGTELHVGIYLLDGLDITPVAAAAAQSNGDRDVLGGIVRDLLNKPQPVPPDPFDQLKKAQTLMDSFAPKTPPSSNDNLFMLMMESQRQASAQMIALLTSKPAGPDPMLVSLLEKQDRRMEKLEAALSAAPPPPPPPPPMMPQTPSYSMPELLTAIAGAASVFIPLIKGDPGMKPMELITMMQGAQAQTQQLMATLMGDRLTAKDMLAFQRDQSSGTPTLVDQMQQLAAVKSFAAELNPPPAGPQGTTFWDAVLALAGNQTFAESLGKRLETPAPARPVTVEDRARPQPQLPPQTPTVEEAQRQPQLPPNFAALCKAMEDGASDGPRVDATLAMFKALQNLSDWQDFIVKLLQVIATNNKPLATQALRQWLDVLVKANAGFSTAGADRVAATFEKHFAPIRLDVLDKAPMLRPFAPEYQTQVAPAAAQVTPAPAPEPAKPVPGAAPEENGQETQTGPAPVDVDLPEEYEAP